MAILLLLLLSTLLLYTPTLAVAQQDRIFFAGFDPAPNSTALSFNGVAQVQPNRILRLTNDSRRLIGHAFYPTPLRFKPAGGGDVYSFSTAFAFAVVPEYPKLGGHGLAFTISGSTLDSGVLPSQYLGLLNASDLGNATDHVFAVEFDTVQDFEFQDINDNHVGVDVNSLQSLANVSAGDINLKRGDTIQAWVDYDGRAKLLRVSLAVSSTKPSSPIISYPIDLSSVFLDQMNVGFSASTGLLASSHYIMGWSFQMNGAAPSLDLSALPSLPKPKKKHTAFVIAACTTAAFFLGAAISGAVYLVRKIRNADIIEPWELEYGPHRFSYRELKLATRGFRDKELLGFGGFGRVYKGTLPSTRLQVAVKRVSHESKQGLREFVAEIATIGRLRHRNLVQLQGWCRRRGDLLLVYDYMANGSLDKYLFDDPKLILSWDQRFRILKGAAAALLYLHEEWDQVVLHRDVKASNVLLDADMNGKLGDFGLARLYEHGANPNTTHVVGTLGYLAPELTRTGKATTGSDVFAFGALLLEVACGRRPIEPKALPEELILVDWVWERWREGRVADTVDPRLGKEFDAAEAELVLKIGLVCSHPAPGERPRMKDVVRCLDGEAAVPEVPAVPPAEYEGRMDRLEFDDFVHSYPSSSDKETGTAASAAFSFNKGAAASSSNPLLGGDGGDRLP